MPDLDHELTALRDELGDSVYPPEFQSIVTRSATRTFRRRRQIGAAVAVLLVGAAIPVFRTALRPVPEPDVPPAASSETPPVTNRVDSGQPFASDTDFVDARNGFSLRNVCVVDNSPVCESTLMITTDAGDHWHAGTLPPLVAHRAGGLATQLWAFDAKHLAVSNTGAAGEDPRWFSEDAGQHWRQVPAKASQTIAAIPPGAIMRWVCVPNHAGCLPGIDVLLPDSGRGATLATPIPLSGAEPAADRPVAGAWWVWSHDPKSGLLALAASRDDGRSWQLVNLPNPPKPLGTGVQVISSDGVLYVTAVGNLPEVTSGLLAIFRSADDGRTWQQTWHAADGKDPRSIGGTPIITAVGQFIVLTQDGRAYGSWDGGNTFTPLREQYGPFAQSTRGGYLIQSPEGPGTNLRMSRTAWAGGRSPSQVADRGQFRNAPGTTETPPPDAPLAPAHPAPGAPRPGRPPPSPHA
jgi:photosystem II stability/assembly factor-like uncharacterized protein